MNATTETTSEPAIPACASGMRRATKDEFFARLKADPRDIMPQIPNSRHDMITGYTEEWRQQHTRVLFGVSDGGTTFLAARYWIADAGTSAER